MKPLNKKTGFFFLGLIFMSLVTVCHTAASTEPARVVITPFIIHAEQNMSFLQNGITDMLRFRISSIKGLDVISREDTEKKFKPGSASIDDKKACQIGSLLGADYVVFGSLTVLGSSVSINAKLLAVTGSSSPFSYYSQSSGMDEVLQKINLFADGACRVILAGVEQTEQPNLPEAEAVPAGSALPQPEIAASPVPAAVVPPGKIPEIVTREDSTSPGPGPAFLKAAEQRGEGGVLWKSRIIKSLVNGLSLGDIDGDGNIEAVIISDHDVMVYRYENDFSTAEKIAKDKYRYYISVDTADINGNGFDEIFVTGLDDQRSKLKSTVLEWNGQEFNRIIKDASWFYRVVDIPGRGRVLFGQYLKDKCTDLSAGEIFEIEWRSSAYRAGKKVLPSETASLAGFSFADIMNSGRQAAVVYDSKNHIKVCEADGETIWQGHEPYGGSTLYAAIPGIANSPGSRIFYPTRLYTRDIDGNSTDDIIAIKNYELTGGFRKNFRNFTEFQIETLAWDKTDLVVKWKTRKFPGHASDFSIGDFDRDGKDELIAVVVKKKGTGIFSKPKCMFIAYELK